MTRKEFDDVMKILNDEYDPFIEKFNGRRLNVYGPGRITAIFKAFEGWSQGRFSELVMRAFETERQAPMVRDLERVAELMRIEDWEKQKRLDRAKAPEQLRAITTGQDSSRVAAMHACLDSLGIRHDRRKA